MKRQAMTMPAAIAALLLFLTACGSSGGEPDVAGDAVADAVAESATTQEDSPPEPEELVEDEEPDEDTAPEALDEVEATEPGAEPDPPVPSGFSLNGFRYCEILITIEGDEGAPTTEVWGTPGVDPCDDAAWDAIDPDAVAGENGASAIKMNGPRYFVVDGGFDTATGAPTAAPEQPEIRDFGGVRMTLLATVADGDLTAPAYTASLVERTTTWTFNAGTEIYELIDAEGNIYPMQSYSLIHDPELTAEDLPTLGDRLDLPEGWSYQSRILDEPLQVGLAAGGAIVITDELENAYQRHVVPDGSEVDPATIETASADEVTTDANSCDTEPTVRSTPDGVDFVRTPDACFDDLPDWPYDPRYVEIDGLRQAYVDEGPADGDVVLLLHGQPSWSYLYRDMIPVFVDAGYRVIAMDHLGMGRSDKPIAIDEYSYVGHAERLEAFMDALGLADVNLFVQDWGSLIGLKVAGENPDRFATITVGDGALPVVPAGFEPFPRVENPDAVVDLGFPFAAFPEQQVPVYDGCALLAPPTEDLFPDWMRYAMTGESFTAGEVVEALTWFDISDEEQAAYNAPFPSRIHMAGPRVFPSLANELGGATAEAWAGLQAFERPFLTLWAANDGGTLGSCEAQQRLIDGVPGACGQPHERLAEASHFLQDDQGEALATRMVDWLGDPATAADCADGS
ncbi:MAG: haloalkane dehalogenase [Actinomycetota bacterium]